MFILMMVEEREGRGGCERGNQESPQPFPTLQVPSYLVVLCVTLDNPFFLNLKVDGREMLPKVALRINNLNVKK